MKNIDSNGHVTGRSIYLDDIPPIQGTLYGMVVGAQLAHAQIVSVDYSEALSFPGVVDILTADSITGENQIGGIIPDEPLFATDEVHFQGQSIALILAESETIAYRARNLVKVEYEAKKVVTDPREAHALGLYTSDARTFNLGNPSGAWEDCAYVFEGKTDSNGQEHLYIETQGAYAIPQENGNIKLHSSTQGPTAVQRTAARVLGVPMHRIEVDVNRLGGGFGGKEDQATPWAVMAALGAHVFNKPVKLVLHRMDDMKMTGKRHPYSSDYKIGLSKDLKIVAYEVTFFQNAGAAADLSPAVMERTLFHSTNAYFVPNVKATAYSCKTNLPPNTAFRGFGGPQGMFVIESAIAHAAMEIGVKPYEIQVKNFLKNGDEFSYGQVADGVELGPLWDAMEKSFPLQEALQKANTFNAENTQFKKGVSLMPICFGISFTKTPMNQARALVHIYSDGSVGISTGAVEMGQGVNTKMLQIAAQQFSIAPDLVKLETTNTTRISNTSPSAASATADLNGKALQLACKVLVKRLKECAAKHFDVAVADIALKDGWVEVGGQKSEMSWEMLIDMAFLARVCLTEHGHYATPIIHYDKTTEKGHPFAYHVYGLALTEVVVDCVRGTYDFESVKIVHDFGQSMNMMVDRGQIEGGLIQGIGWMTMEEISYNEEGRLNSNSLSTYKIPDIYSVPKEVVIEALETAGTDMAILKSKAVGEPPLMYGIGAYFAIQAAVQAYNADYKQTFDAPFTHEKVLMALYGQSIYQSARVSTGA